MPRTNTRAQQARNKRILAADRTCWLCGHDGADAVDHKVPVDLAPELENEPTNLAPSHHFDPCPTCGIKCNRVKSNKLVAPIIRRSGALRRPGGPPPGPA